MSKILNLYTDLNNKRKRFIDELFDGDEYREALPKLTILDIGAYEGEFAFYSLNCADKIYCFEPDPVPFAELKRRVEDFSLGDKIQIYPIALSDSKGIKKFNATHEGGSRIEELGTLEVETMTLAEFMKENNIEHVDILKVDIEDGEIALFNSPDFKDVVDKIDLIIGEHLASVDQLLKDYGFKVRPVNNNVIYEK